MISYVICDNQDTLTAFALCGIQGQILADNHDLMKTLQGLIEEKNIGLMLISQSIYDQYVEALSYEMIEKKQTIFVAIPGPKEKIHGSFKDHMMGLAGVKK